LSYLVNRQTNKRTNKVWQKHYLPGGGNYKFKNNLQIIMIMRLIFVVALLFKSPYRLHQTL